MHGIVTSKASWGMLDIRGLTNAWEFRNLWTLHARRRMDCCKWMRSWTVGQQGSLLVSPDRGQTSRTVAEKLEKGTTTCHCRGLTHDSPVPILAGISSKGQAHNDYYFARRGKEIWKYYCRRCSNTTVGDRPCIVIHSLPIADPCRHAASFSLNRYNEECHQSVAGLYLVSQPPPSLRCSYYDFEMSYRKQPV